ncbi:acyl-CoA reductase [Arundinibacter roseus]|uniref:Acyl-CoA reductase n=1 Tax=Arundinibacter roseus TaxID=2070510 RepID=A0A4R4KG98_9BACT|nr:acyl-CoA reductase [Arundinibacter roseus]TDB67018.1 acyl-CoA reductase [Arundinibacter roseus]
MIPRKKRIDAFVNLGNYLKDPIHSIELEGIAAQARNINSWFIPENVRLAVQKISEQLLAGSALLSFLDTYEEVSESKKIGVVMAGNIPAVGFHDALCVLLSGHHLLAKVSSDDAPLMMYLLETLLRIEPEFVNYLSVVQKINVADAYIATGSDNSSRYFDYYFSAKPHIIRKNRTSVAILTGDESGEELEALGDDILHYFGLGCRNVSKVYVPENYNFSPFFDAQASKMEKYQYHHKYFNNYEYNKSILLVNRVPHLDNGFLIVNENQALVSPLSVLYFETYSSDEQLSEELGSHSEKIQCIVGPSKSTLATVPFGKAQSPGIADYADGVDTMAFLRSF